MGYSENSRVVFNQQRLNDQIKTLIENNQCYTLLCGGGQSRSRERVAKRKRGREREREKERKQRERLKYTIDDRFRSRWRNSKSSIRTFVHLICRAAERNDRVCLWTLSIRLCVAVGVWNINVVVENARFRRDARTSSRCAQCEMGKMCAPRAHIFSRASALLTV